MLSPKNRLQREQDVLAVIRHGRRFVVPCLDVYIKNNSKEGLIRVACVAGKKVHKSAVRRHKIQRWLREIARDVISNIGGSYDMVWVAKPDIINMNSKKDLEKKILPHINKLF